MGRREKHSIRSYLQNVVMHLLKWQYQPQRRGASWELSIRNGRDQLNELIADSPSLHPQIPGFATDIYPRARRNASGETGLPLIAFPEQCPFTIEHITGDYWPD